MKIPLWSLIHTVSEYQNLKRYKIRTSKLPDFKWLMYNYHSAEEKNRDTDSSTDIGDWMMQPEARSRRRL